VNYSVLKALNCTDVTVSIVRVEAAEVDEMWRFVAHKNNQRWLWHAIDHATGQVLAYVFGSRKDVIFKQLKNLLVPFFYTDDWGAYKRKLPRVQHTISKSNTQKIERKHLTLRTGIKRLARKTIFFSKLEKMHDIVIGLFINRYEFQGAV